MGNKIIINREQNVFIIGSKGIPGAYGGYETFVDRLTDCHRNLSSIKYHVACKGKDEKEFIYNNARCFYINVPDIGPAQAIYYDVVAMKKCIEYITVNKIENPIIYILACRIGPFMSYYKRKLKKIGCRIFINPDGHEFLRDKWSYSVKKYWKISESLMVKNADLVVCDSRHIENYIQNEYRKYKPKTTFIAYGTDVNVEKRVPSNKLRDWFDKNGVIIKQYYLMVGRFVPENNYETVIREFMESKTDKSLVIITTNNSKFYKKLNRKLKFIYDSRIKFVGTVYDRSLLEEIRSNAFAYIHGHEVGGTNPSLLEALSSTQLNLLIDVGFNREVADSSALYWTKREKDLSSLINDVENKDDNYIEHKMTMARKRMEKRYSWKMIADKYKEIFLS